MTPEQKRLERYRRYNASAKGRARRDRYDARHPERTLPRWARQAGARLPEITYEPDMFPSPEWYNELYMENY
jgi:hypothetical protein